MATTGALFQHFYEERSKIFVIVLEKSLAQADGPSSSLAKHRQIDCFLREAITNIFYSV